MRDCKTTKKNYFYVLVCTEGGAKFVTSTKGSMAYWNVNDKPIGMTKKRAEELMIGLNINGYNAFVVMHPREIYNHPYDYKNYKCEWKEID